MQKHLWSVASLAILLWSAPINADPTYTLTSKWWNKYHFASGAIVADVPVLNTDLFVGWENGWYVDIWHSMGTDGSGLASGFDDEIDYTVGYQKSVGKTDVDGGISYYDTIDLFSFSDAFDTIRPYLDVQYRVIDDERYVVSPFILVEGLIVPAAGGDGAYITTGIRSSFQINDVVSMSPSIGVLYDTGVYGADSGYVGQLAGELNWSVSPRVSVMAPHVKYTTNMSKLRDGRSDEFTWGLGISINF